MQKKLNVLSTFTLKELILINVTQMNTKGINHHQKDTRNCCPDFLSFNVLLGCLTLDMRPQLNPQMQGFGECWEEPTSETRLGILLPSLFESDTYYACSSEFLIWFVIGLCFLVAFSHSLESERSYISA